MDTVTYPDPRTVDFVSKFLIAFRVSTEMWGRLAGSYGIQYTPTVLTVDGDAREHHRSVGFLPPDEFVPSLMLGSGKMYLNNRSIRMALTMFEKILLAYPRSGFAAEAARLKQTCQGQAGAR
jgi:hypothetical protein